MTANELADELTAPLGKSGESTYSVATQAAAMLRAQHEAINTLREALKGAHRRLKEYDYQAMEGTIARCEAALAATEKLHD